MNSDPVFSLLVNRKHRLSTIRVLDPAYRVYLCSMSAQQGDRIAIGGDHAGYGLKRILVERLRSSGFTVLDQGTDSVDSMDYPDPAHRVAQLVQEGDAVLGVLICGSGNGVNIVANKHHGVRSALAWNEELARLGRQHNNANVLALPARFIDQELAERILEAFLHADSEGGRHLRRVEKIESGASC